MWLQLGGEGFDAHLHHAPLVVRDALLTLELEVGEHGSRAALVQSQRRNACCDRMVALQGMCRERGISPRLPPPLFVE